MIWAIGDVHGKIESYEKLLVSIRKQDKEAITFQVGDMGVGFKGVNYPKVTPNDYWIAGNHDDALVCEKCPGNLGDYGHKIINERKIFWVRGALSIDRAMRVEGETWWAYEELTYQQLNDAVSLYKEIKPDIVISHDCPRQLHAEHYRYKESGRTVEALGVMLEAHSPTKWVYGHYHVHYDNTIFGTRFICLAELQHKKIL